MVEPPVKCKAVTPQTGFYSLFNEVEPPVKCKAVTSRPLTAVRGTVEPPLNCKAVTPFALAVLIDFR